MKKNKETKKHMREAAVLYRDTSKLEKKIERYHSIRRKLTAVENEKLQSLDAELKETLERQKEAGIEPGRRKQPTDGQAIGYDPLADAQDQDALVEYNSSSDSESIDNDIVGKEIPLGQEYYEREPAAPVALDSHIVGVTGRDSLSLGHGDDTLDDEQFPPMPEGTPPLLQENVDSDGVWPLVPSGPSPQFEAQYLQANGQRTNANFGARGRGRQFSNNGGRGRGGEPRGRGHARGRGTSHYHPFAQMPMQHVPASRRQFPLQSPPVPPFAVSAQHPAVQPPHRPQPAPSSGTVLAAEPQVRDLKKELTALVPSAIARKNKQNDRQRVLESVPMPPQMVINAAPDVGVGQAEPANRAGQSDSSLVAKDVIGNIRPVAGVSFNVASSSSKNESVPPKKEADKAKSDSLSDKYQTFASQID
ncbi:hypothetical protein LPJ59_001394 [Coemansia sp. RSA 2399]|nr:hypothetical protein LPJ59_001394 [Coemansia sp. RSA 2399]